MHFSYVLLAKIKGERVGLNDYIVFKTNKNFNNIGRLGDDSWNTIDKVSIEQYGKYALRDIYPTDYAVALGAMLSQKTGKLGRKKGWAWLRNGHSNVTENFSSMLGNKFEDIVDKYDGCIVPSMSLDISKVEESINSNKTDFRFMEKKYLGDKFMGLQFGWYPKTFVGGTENRRLEAELSDGRAKPTGKEYITGLDDKGNPEFCKEYEVDNTRYVRVEAFSPDFDSEFASGETFNDYEPTWFAVEPITWIVKNWKDLPKSINPKGSGKATTLDIVAHEGIMAGIPFYPNTDDLNRGLWQNSTLRGYLNGTNVNNIKLGGNTNYSAPNGGDYRLHSFLSEAFEPVKQKQNTMSAQPSIASTIQKMTEENKEKKMRFSDFIVPKTMEYEIDEQKVINNDLIYIDDETIEDRDKYYLRACYASDYATINGAFISDGPYGLKCEYFVRRAYYHDVDVKKITDDGNLDSETVGDGETCIRPSVQLDVEKVMKAQKEMSNPFKIAKIEGGDSGKLNFGEYPQSYVGTQVNADMENAYQRGLLKQTGKKYLRSYWFSFERGPQEDNAYEFEHNGEKYVRVLSHRSYEDTLFKNGEDVPEFDEPCWVKVEPITWNIRNWDELPKELNPNGNGTAKVIDIQTEDAIACDIPFYPANADENNNLWQNSTIRGYLNGIDVNNIKTNGNPNFSAPRGGDFSGQGFIREAGLDKEINMTMGLANTEEKRVSLKKRKGYGIEIEEMPKSIDAQLRFYIENGMSVMLHGPSGVGKTRRIEEIDPEFVSIVLRNGILPEEVIGKNIYPNMENTDAGKWVPPSWYVDLCEKCKKEPDKMHTLFIDEITNVRPYEQSLVYHLVLNNSIGPNYGKLPDNAVVVAAGNSMEESSSAYNMPEPLFRRFAGHVYLPLDIPSWLDWGSKRVKVGEEERVRIHPLVSNFVATYGEKVFHSKYNAEEPPKYSIDPRGWEQLSKVIYASNGKLSKELIENKLGTELANNFVAFARKTPLFVEDIVDGNYSNDDIPLAFDERYAMVLSFRYASKADLPKVRKFVEKYFGGEMLAIFDEKWVNGEADKAIYLNIIKKQAKAEKKDEEPAVEEQSSIEPSKSLTGKNEYSDLLVGLTPKGLANLYSVCRKVSKDAMDGKIELESLPNALYTHIEEIKWPVLIVMMEEQGVFESVENTLKFINVVCNTVKGQVKSEDQGMRR